VGRGDYAEIKNNGRVYNSMEDQIPL
jgi:hypothetical protein